MSKNDFNNRILNNYEKQKVLEESNNYLKILSHNKNVSSNNKNNINLRKDEEEVGMTFIEEKICFDEKIEVEEVFTLEILIKILSKIFLKGNYSLTKDDINIANCKVMIFESKYHLNNTNDEVEDFINMLFYFQNKNYLIFIIYCLNKKNIVYLNFFNPLLSEKETIEAFNLFFMNNFFPHIILGLNNGRILLYNHEGIMCMYNKFVEYKLKNIFIENQKDYILFLYENNIIVNSNIHLIKRALETNSKTLPYDYMFTINKNISLSHIILRCDNSYDLLKKELYTMYNKEDLMRYINDNINTNPNTYSGNINYIITSKTITLSILNIIKPNTPNDFLSRKENFSTSEKLSSKINNFIKNIFTKKNENAPPSSASSALPSSVLINQVDYNMNSNNTSTNDILNSKIVHSFNDSKRQIIDICICPWNTNLLLALDNLGRISLFNLSTLNILYMWKSYRSAFMSFIQKQNYNCFHRQNKKKFQDTPFNQFDKGILFYLKNRSLIEIWDFKTLNKIYSVRTYECPIFSKLFFGENNVPNKVILFNSSHHVFLMNTNFELLYLKWV